MTVQTFQPGQVTLHLTEAANKQALREIQRASASGIRLDLDESGCSGFMYTLDFVEEPKDGDKLFVSFESMSGIEALSETRTPIGFDMVGGAGWSSLSLLSHGDTWFRDPRVYAFFDQLQDDGFFDEFETVLFFGAGPCGYAAGAYSVTAPGARVLMLQPQATLDPRVAEWDDRFAEERRRDFTVDWVHLKLNDQAQRTVLCKDPFRAYDERVQRLIDSM